MSGRTRLPNRRPQLAVNESWAGREWRVGMGFDTAGKVREVFARGVKTGQHLEGLLDDACILMSILLQSGMDAAALAAHLGREGVDPAAGAASLIGQIARRAAAAEREAGPAMAELAAAAARLPRWVPRQAEPAGPTADGSAAP